MRIGWRGVGAVLSMASAVALADDPKPGAPAPIRFERIAIDENFPGAYQVEVVDVNGDRKPDIVVVGGSTLAWYENPTWIKRVVSTSKQTPAIISSATADLDGDGRAEIAIAYDFAMNEPKRGKLLLAVQGPKSDDPWTFRPIADVPSIHRLRWGDVDGDGRPELVVASIFGPKARPPAFDQDPAALAAYFTGADPKAGRWEGRILTHRPILHAIEVRPGGRPDDAGVAIYTADGRAVARISWDRRKHQPTVEEILGPKIPSPAWPKLGWSEVHLGHVDLGRREFLAMINPWHGSRVVVFVFEPFVTGSWLGPAVLDTTLDDGHALWVADVDGDGDDEVFAGHRGKDHRISVYRRIGRDWIRTVIDTTVAAQDLRGGDIDGDGVPDIVAVGGKTHNVVWYRPIRPEK